ncbi:MAG: CVNH domain-containing protein [Nostoc sp.]|uniref:mannose-binding lectin n=1 Tax=Nostoc sp. TaxID=1180 RepID=UPI002FF8BAF8
MKNGTKIMKQNLQKLIGVIGVLVSTSFVDINNPANAAPSTFQQSCNNITISGNILMANCSRINGSFNQSSLVLLGIENIDGTLKVTNPRKVSNYQLSCDNIGFNGFNGNLLKATCKRRSGIANNTSLVLNGIENINGFLKYTSAP